MIRRISTKWVLAVLAVVVLPFLGFAWYVDSFVAQRFSVDVVQYHLLGHAAELAERLDLIVEERRDDAQLLAANGDIRYCLGNVGTDREDFLMEVQKTFDDLVSGIGSADMVVGLDDQGMLVASSTLDAEGNHLQPWTMDALRNHAWGSETWFAEAMENGTASIDVMRSPFLHDDDRVPLEELYQFGFAHRVMNSRSTTGPIVPVGVVVTLVSWERVQAEITDYGVSRRRKEVGPQPSEDLYASSYAWIWGSDGNTILAHKDRSLYGALVSEPPVSLPQMAAASQQALWGMYPDYTFDGVDKKAAFRHGKPVADGGFDWIIGVGVNAEDIYGPIHSMTERIATASGLVLLLAVVVTVLVARRTTRPVQDLEAFTRRVASGDLDAQVPVKGHDELSDLARSFNRMTHRLKDNREQLVKAEKDAAWREMARQVAHEIKNPLTPIQLWASLLKRAHDDESPEFESIFEKTISVVQNQVAKMRDIAKDFYRFAGEHRDPVPVDSAEVMDSVIELNSAWASAENIRLERLGGEALAAGGATVKADPDEIYRAFINLVSNAMEAIEEVDAEEGGHAIEAVVEVVRDAGVDLVQISIRDTGKGISEEAQAGLFQPYFTTRSSGTGLGLAIVRRIVEDLGGGVTLSNRPDRRGAEAVIRLPAFREAGVTP